MRTLIIEQGQVVQPEKYKEQKDIEKVIIHEGAIIGKKSFDDCTGITEITIAKDVNIGDAAFNLCTSIAELNIAEGVTIGDFAFEKCTGITHLNIAEGVTIGWEAFWGCTGITMLNIAKGVTIGELAFEDCTGITKLNIARGMIIGRWAFRSCTGITEVNIAKGVRIGEEVFWGCKAITEVNIAEGATVDQTAFEDCTIPLVHLGVNNTDLDKCIHNFPLDFIERRLSFNAQLVKDKVKMMTTYLQLLKLETWSISQKYLKTIPVSLVYCYKGQGTLSHLRYLSREVKNKIIKILCCFKNYEVRLNNDIVLNHIIAPPNVKIKLYYNSIEPSEDNFAKKEISASHWLA